jgi:hypothetical protein
VTMHRLPTAYQSPPRPPPGGTRSVSAQFGLDRCAPFDYYKTTQEYGSTKTRWLLVRTMGSTSHANPVPTAEVV